MSETSFRVDFTNVETKNFDPVPTGKYLLAITDYELKECSEQSKNPGKPLVQHEFTIQEPHEIGGVKVAERKLWTNFMPTIENTLWRLKNFLEALGDDVSGGLNYDPEEILARPYEKRLLVAKVSLQGPRKDKNSGKTYDERNEIKTFYLASTWKNGTPVSAGSGANNSLLP
jgi:uncharacterized protein DUF669